MTPRPLFQGKITKLTTDTVRMESSRGETIIVLHPVHAAVGRAELRLALAPEERELPHFVDIPALHIPYGTNAIDWPAAVDAQEQQLSERYFPRIRTFDTPNVIYAGRAPIPLVVHLGHRLGPFLEVQARQPHHETKSWKWDETPYPRLEVTSTGLPRERHSAEGDVVIRVATSFAIDPTHTRSTVPPKCTLAEIDINSLPLGRDVVHHPESIRRVAEAFRGALTAIRDYLPGTNRIHLFAAVPLGLAFQLGNQIQANIDRHIVTYQFNPGGPPYFSPAIVVQESAGQAPPLSEEEQTAATAIRSLWQDQCCCVATFARAIAKERDSTNWLGGFEPSDREAIVRELPPGWDVLPDIRGTALARAQLNAIPLLGDEPYAYAPREAEWSVADGFLAAVAGRIVTEEDRRLAGSLFLLHEGFHRSVHGLTENTARGIGRFPKAIEAADYQADLWALVQLADLEGARTVDFLDHAIRIALETMWAFTGVSAHLPRLEVRATNRFLNWYWQLAQIRSETSFARAIACLANPPIIELSGPAIAVTRGRPALCLTPGLSRQPELVLFRNARIIRVGHTEAARLEDLVLGLAERNGTRIISVLAGVSDSLRGP